MKVFFGISYALTGLVLLSLSGCGSREKIEVTLAGGNAVKCDYMTAQPCGYHLYGCDDGKEYYCQNGFSAKTP